MLAPRTNRRRPRAGRIAAAIAVAALGGLLGAPVSAGSMVVQRDGKILLAGTGLRELRGFGALVRYLPNGKLDPTFARRGILLDTRFNPLSALAQQGDGRILVGAPQRTSAQYAEHFTFGRYLASGDRDLSFGEGGAVKEQTGFVPTAILPRNDGRFAVAANAPYESGAPAFGSVGSARIYASDGLSFRTAGNVNAEASDGSPRSSELADLLARPDGSLIGAGALSQPGVAFLAKFAPGGGSSYDQSFGGGAGIVEIAPPPLPGSRASALVAVGDGVIVVGTVGDGMFVARFKGDGTLDSSFGEGGLVTLAVDGRLYTEANAVAVQPNGRIVVVGTSRRPVSGSPPSRRCDSCSEAVVVRFTANGVLDPAFGSGGMARLASSGGGSLGATGDDVSLLPGGKILVAAVPTDGGDATFALARLDADGGLDRSFGNGGLVTTDTCPGSEAQKRRARCLPSLRVRLRASRLADGSLRLRTVVGSNIPRARVMQAKLLLPRGLRFRRAFVKTTNECRKLCGYGGGSNSHAEVKAFPGGVVFNQVSAPRLSFVLAGYAFQGGSTLRTVRELEFRVAVRFRPGEPWQTAVRRDSV